MNSMTYDRPTSLPFVLSALRSGCGALHAEHYNIWQGRQPARWLWQKGVQRSTLASFQPQLHQALPLIQSAIAIAQVSDEIHAERSRPSGGLESVLSFMNDLCVEAQRHASRGIGRQTLEDLEQAILLAIPLVEARIAELEQAEFDEVAEVNHPVAEWMRGACERTGRSEIATLHADHCGWCEAESRNLTPCGPEGFVDILRESGFTEMTSAYRQSEYDDHAFPTHVRGLRLRSTPPGDEAVPTAAAEQAA